MNVLLGMLSIAVLQLGMASGLGTASLLEAFELEQSDEQLMSAYQRGDYQAFAELYQRHSSRVYGYLKSKLKDRAQADEVFQGTFLKLHHSRACYDAAFPFAPWLYTVCKSVLLDAVRRRDRILEDPSAPEILEKASIAGMVDSASERSTESLPGIAELPPEQRQALELRYQQELSFAQIANALQTTPGNARQLVSRAVRRLRGTR